MRRLKSGRYGYGIGMELGRIHIRMYWVVVEIDRPASSEP